MHNALGFAYFNMQKYDLAIAEYKQAVEKQPGYNLPLPHVKPCATASGLSTWKALAATARPDSRGAS